MRHFRRLKPQLSVYSPLAIGTLIIFGGSFAIATNVEGKILITPTKTL